MKKLLLTSLTAIALPLLSQAGSRVDYHVNVTRDAARDVETPSVIRASVGALAEAFNRSSIGECILHVPAVSVDNYKASYIWGAFKEVVPLTDSDSKPTGIDDVRCKISDIRGTYYDLNGVRQSEAKRGINILNGKKVVVK